ncbi:rod shape-determining protein MreC [Azovibrio restrictus]|uniref:rod shape-determining protein MreC n=1 Tax=Azovibrio restrictus TaxID=146938 RepID=UPI0026EFC5E6|nr:rod shape-determining protein MreC [Azovibrio restrictus]MDD3482794.1 rod shape-determining protein MreC [Azovibrio restrictus]
MAVLDHAPPPFFKRGPAPLALLSFYVAFSIALFVLDLRFHALDIVRQAISLGTDPLQRLAQAPMRMLTEGSDYFLTLESVQEENRALRTAQLATAPTLLRLEQLEAENERLRQLLALQSREKAAGQAARILYTARDPFARRVFLDKGQQQGLIPGQPVIDEGGIIGQITRVFPFSAEVTLVTDKNQAVPVQVQRTGQRSVTFGLGNGQVELKYIPANADVQVGDMLITSGLDGVYLPGFPVARVIHVERDSAYAFARIVAAPLAAVESHTVVMVLHPRQPLPPRPPAPEAEGGKPAAKPTRAGN